MTFGFLNINKPVGMTSHDVVAAVRRHIRLKRVGHAGTLDPLASGVLVVCVGLATRLSEYVMHTTKGYQARVRLGVVTDTYDAEGETLREADPSGITQAQVEALLPQFTGDIAQVPPMYSAIKKDGKKLYELARAGETLDLPSRSVRIESLKVSAWDGPEFTLDVQCGSGTYIRSLAYDIGEALGVGAHLSGLVRTQSGAFTVADAVTLEDFRATEDWQQYLILPREAMPHVPLVTLDAAGYADIQQGRRIVQDEAELVDGVAQAYSPTGDFAAILSGESGFWKPQKVFHAEG